MRDLAAHLVEPDVRDGRGTVEESPPFHLNRHSMFSTCQAHPRLVRPCRLQRNFSSGYLCPGSCSAIASWRGPRRALCPFDIRFTLGQYFILGDDYVMANIQSHLFNDYYQPHFVDLRLMTYGKR